MDGISVNAEKTFLVARTRVEKRILCGQKRIFGKNIEPTPVNVRSGYSLYCRWTDGKGERLEKIAGGEILSGTVSSATFSKYFSKNAEGWCDLYWIAGDGGHRISVPWGCRVKGDGYNGVLTVELTDAEKFLNSFLSCPWERETLKGCEIEYLSEYFIDGDGRQKGISIELRNLIKPAAEDVINENSSKDVAFLTAKTEEKIKEIPFSDYGLEFKSVTLQIQEKTENAEDA